MAGLIIPSAGAHDETIVSTDALRKHIQMFFWENLTKRLDVSSASVTEIDEKVRTDSPRPRIYIPHDEREQYNYYLQIANERPDLHLDVQLLPAGVLTPEYIRDLNDKPGALAMAVDDSVDDSDTRTSRPLPFVVPGGRFNEMYGWDSYFQSLGLLLDDHVDVCISMLRHMCFCLQHYGKILNANRSYYLGRSQPPFLTSMGLAVFRKMDTTKSTTLELVKIVLFAAIKEYHTVWMSEPRYDAKTGLSRYHGEGHGFPPEVEPSHFQNIISQFAEKHKMSNEELVSAYNDGRVEDSELDEYLIHDRAGRESGHDTSYRLDGNAADLVTVDLNSCLYKYEIDIASIIETYFNGAIQISSEFRAPGQESSQTASTWIQRAAKRKASIDKYLWSDKAGMYFDYNVKREEQTLYESATTLWPLWAGAASSSQAKRLASQALPKFEVHGGIVSSTESSRGPISSGRPLRQWDYPYGWAPHQILAWDGFLKYGYYDIAFRLARRWTSMIARTFSDFNGLVVEKYDVTKETESHVAEAEYGNQGSDFNSPCQTGFGWTNASFVYGLSILENVSRASDAIQLTDSHATANGP